MEESLPFEVFELPRKLPRGKMHEPLRGRKNARPTPGVSCLNNHSVGAKPDVSAVSGRVFTQPLKRAVDALVHPVGRKIDEVRRDLSDQAFEGQA
jgi:hypothetical protein